MVFSFRAFCAVTLMICASYISVYAQQVLTIESAVKAAIARDTLLNVYQLRSDAYREEAIVANTLPDPQIKLGMMNVPTDTFSLNQEPMTQLQIGVVQIFPRGNSLQLKSQRAMILSSMEKAKRENQQRQLVREVRKTWLEYFYWKNAKKIVKENRNYFSELVAVTQQQYAAGRRKQQDVIRSELELGMLDDRQIKIKNMLEIIRARLARYIGKDPASIQLDSQLPGFSVNSSAEEWLDKHPLMKIEQAKISAGEKAVELARQSYKPSWMLDITYSKREKSTLGQKRADFISAMAKVDLPLFTGNRQDKIVAASKLRLNDAFNAREEQRRILLKLWNENRASQKRLQQRILQYQDSLLPKAKENSRSALYAYQNGKSEFSVLMRAQITDLEIQLKALRLKIDFAKTQSELLYLVGENE